MSHTIFKVQISFKIIYEFLHSIIKYIFYYFIFYI